MDKIHFKECAPEVTVQKLKNILREMGIETEEVSFNKSEIDTFSLRVLFKGTNFGTNGKGVSKEYCEASAYAELFERFQNDLMPQGVIDLDKRKYSFFKAFDERILTTPEIISDNNSFIQFYFQRRGKENAFFQEKVDMFNEVQRTDFWLFGYEGSYLTLPFYGFKRQRLEYLPYSTYGLYYGSNGMCAGNTPQEALVQGLSEIFERVAQRRILIEKPVLPDIPESYIKNYPLIDSLFTKLKKNNKKHEYFLKDCSFGGQYPVAALIIVEKNTGRFGVKLGCHPNFGIAMERCFTEATQGRDIDDYSKISYFDFNNLGVDSDYNICNSFKTGQAQFPYQVFGTNPTYEFYAFEDVSESSNEEILNEWISQILKKGYDVLIRDVSYLGFPSFQIIIPGISELQDADDRRFRALHTKFFTQRIFAEKEGVSTKNISYILATLQFFENIELENGVDQLFATDNFSYPCEKVGLDSKYMQAMCYAFAGEYKNAENMMFDLLQTYTKRDPNADIRLYLGIAYFFSAMNEVKDFDKAMAYIDILFSKDIYKKIEDIFKDKRNIFLSQYPCGQVKNQQQKIIDQIRDKLFEKQLTSGISQENVKNMISIFPSNKEV